MLKTVKYNMISKIFILSITISINVNRLRSNSSHQTPMVVSSFIENNPKIVKIEKALV